MSLPWKITASTVLSLLLLAGCGGGGGGGGGSGSAAQSLSLSTTSVTVSATTIDAAPTAQVTVAVGNAAIGISYFVQATTTNSGITAVNVASGSAAFEATGSVVINFKAPASLAVGTYTDSVTVRGCYDQSCSRLLSDSPQTITVKYTVSNPVPTVTALNPSSSSAGAGALSLTVYGTEFTSNSVVNWNGTARSTTYISSTQLTAQITAADVAASGAIPVTVSNPGIATSGAVTFAINPAALTSVTPTFIAAGGPAFTLNVLGSGFANSSVVQWNGSARTTTFVSATQLQAQITSPDIAAPGSAALTVLTPSAAGGSTAPIAVAVATLPSWPASAHAVAYRVNPGHTGAVTFSSVTFPTSSAWTVDFGATVSYPLIADGKVFVTVINSSSNSNLYALDQTTGGTVWGPIPIVGIATPAYDNGTVFVSSGVNPSGGQGNVVAIGSVQAFNAATGALLWNTPMSGFDTEHTSAPTAANGYVYVTGGGSGPSALDESTGTVSWSSQAGAGIITPAVSASGAYVGCEGYNPTTGQPLWASAPSCASSPYAGAATSLAGSMVFSPNGAVLDATTGASLGSFSAAAPPAFDSQSEYAIQPAPAGASGNLQALIPGSNTVKWTFTGDSTVCAAMVISQYVIAAGCAGNLYGLDAATGKQVWLANPGAPTFWDFTWRTPLPTMTAGDGVLIAHGATKLTAYLLATGP